MKELKWKYGQDVGNWYSGQINFRGEFLYFKIQRLCPGYELTRGYALIGAFNLLKEAKKSDWGLGFKNPR